MEIHKEHLRNLIVHKVNKHSLLSIKPDLKYQLLTTIYNPLLFKMLSNLRNKRFLERFLKLFNDFVNDNDNMFSIRISINKLSNFILKKITLTIILFINL